MGGGKGKKQTSRGQNYRLTEGAREACVSSRPPDLKLMRRLLWSRGADSSHEDRDSEMTSKGVQEVGGAGDSGRKTTEIGQGLGQQTPRSEV